MTENLTWHPHQITPDERRANKGHGAAVLWFTGLSGSGKSTIANALEQKLHQAGVHSYLLDGDNVRHGLNRDLGFSDDDRVENLRRVSEVAALMADAGLVVLTAFISPFRSERDAVRQRLPEGQFIEVFIDTPLAECERRDPKGLYQKARAGTIRQFTGIDSKYQAPEQPDVHLRADQLTPEQCAERLLAALRERGVIG
ncbi:adenylylsulfate kinase [Ferrimonas balearica DSM 9799]|uniref:Adenylyl-sulfate kinase n=1 Tax=Ferrimonas balearica (strain DSM 9799 / CCM 4581 / KCTC 23876 / PAT) TaxID=550540 RepID=E1SVH3_FERBD|nr:adenylyl-sulfate kinase [Ferrimonas balearica]ADN75319.1 adenylylsulfate kinase [Ferrimonas balearica DSM 9799]